MALESSAQHRPVIAPACVSRDHPQERLRHLQRCLFGYRMPLTAALGAAHSCSLPIKTLPWGTSRLRLSHLPFSGNPLQAVRRASSSPTLSSRKAQEEEPPLSCDTGKWGSPKEPAVPLQEFLAQHFPAKEPGATRAWGADISSSVISVFLKGLQSYWQALWASRLITARRISILCHYQPASCINRFFGLSEKVHDPSICCSCP